MLPDSVADDPDRLARFQREAEVLASLNHPNIAAIYGLEGEAENRALVLELVEGPTLADRIAQGPIPLDEAIAIARQIADALEAAHEAGIIHRDLKPANIKVREDGTVKVLDFGLAKALGGDDREGDPSESPTLTTAATRAGVIMGTAAYMSPEQAKGKPVDKRADVWGFGAVLYEMLTGKRPFAGDDVSETLAFVLTKEPDLFSPDGQWVAISQGGYLKRLALSGGAPVVICPVTMPFGAYWAPDDTIFFAQLEGIFRVSANGGTPELVVAAADGERVDAPQLLPDGDSLLFSNSTNEASQGRWEDARIVVSSLATGERTVLVEGGSDARYVSSGHLVYALEDGMFAVAFDDANLSVSGGAVSLVQGLVRAGATASANYAVSENGDLVYLTGTGTSNLALAWVDRTGLVELIETIPPNNYIWPRLSPDGERLLVVGQGDARIYDLASGRESRLTTDGATDYVGWTPTGTEITYTSVRGTDGQEIWIQPADGSGEARQLTTMSGDVDFDGWAPNGRTILAHHHIDGTVNQLVIAYDGENAEPQTWLGNEHLDSNGVFSPDGNYVAHVSEQTGQREIYIRAFPGPGGQTTVSVGGGSEPTWAPNGELFYRRPGDSMMMVVEVATEPVLTVGPPVELFAGKGDFTGSANPRYTVTPDGQRFIMSTALLASDGTSSESPGRIVIVQNWVEELKARVPN